MRTRRCRVSRNHCQIRREANRREDAADRRIRRGLTLAIAMKRGRIRTPGRITRAFFARQKGAENFGNGTSTGARTAAASGDRSRTASSRWSRTARRWRPSASSGSGRRTRSSAAGLRPRSSSVSPGIACRELLLVRRVGVDSSRSANTSGFGVVPEDEQVAVLVAEVTPCRPRSTASPRSTPSCRTASSACRSWRRGSGGSRASSAMYSDVVHDARGAHASGRR